MRDYVGRPDQQIVMSGEQNGDQERYYEEIVSVLFNGSHETEKQRKKGLLGLFGQLFLGFAALPHHNHKGEKKRSDQVWEEQQDCLQQYLGTLAKAEQQLNAEADDLADRASKLLDMLDANCDLLKKERNSSSGCYAEKTDSYDTAKRYFSIFTYPCTAMTEAEAEQQLKRTISDVEALYDGELRWLFKGWPGARQGKMEYLRRTLPQEGAFLPETKYADGQVLLYTLLWNAYQNPKLKGMERKKTHELLKRYFCFPLQSESEKPQTEITVAVQDLEALCELLGDEVFCTALHEKRQLHIFAQRLIPLVQGAADGKLLDAICDRLDNERNAVFEQLSKMNRKADKEEYDRWERYSQGLYDLIREVEERQGRMAHSGEQQSLASK